ncbi:MAG: BON domain-containing protein [Thermoguttaceae bacterium]|jgi:osmotically-inducible protein OsmY
MLLEIHSGTLSLPDFSSPTSADSDLERRVATFLAGQHRYALRLLEVEARSGVVTIRGSVSTFYEKQLSAELVRRVAGVIRLVDEVIVQSTPHPRSTDSSSPGLQDSSFHSAKRNYPSLDKA